VLESIIGINIYLVYLEWFPNTQHPKEVHSTPSPLTHDVRLVVFVIKTCH